MAQGTVFALRQKIAKIEGLGFRTLASPDTGETVLRQEGIALRGDRVSEYASSRQGPRVWTHALGGGLPDAALIEIHGGEVRDAGAVAGFVPALAGLNSEPQGPDDTRLPVLWIGVSQDLCRNRISLCAGNAGLSGLSQDELLISHTPKLIDALWIAEEAARLKELSAGHSGDRMAILPGWT